MGKRAFLIAASLAGAGSPARASNPSDAEQEQKLNNPISDQARIPFQFNWDEGVGPEEELKLTLKIEPVVPVPIGGDWSVIGRFILPVISQPPAEEGGTSQFGFGDIQFEIFVTPRGSGRLTVGLGPILGLPATSNPALGSGMWSAGPVGAVFYQGGGWTAGLLAYQLWSYASAGEGGGSDVNQAFFQPIVSYTAPSATTFGLQSETTVDWDAAKGERWTAPLELLISQLTRLGSAPLSVQAGAGVYVAKPTGGPEWRLRLAFTLLVPPA